MLLNNFKKMLVGLLSSPQGTGSWPSWPGNITFKDVLGNDVTVLSGEANYAYFANAFNHATTDYITLGYVTMRVGTGTTEPTLDDYNLESIPEGITVDSVTVTNTSITTKTYTAICSNSSDSDITITEVGLYMGSATGYLLDRTILDTPITIPAGESRAVTYELGF